MFDDERDRPVLCGVDDSDAAHAVLSVAAALAASLQRELVVVHALQGVAPGEVGVDEQAAATLDRDFATAAALIERLVHEAELPAVPWRARIEPGLTAGQLAEVAGEEHAALLVVGSRGRGPRKGAILGSVSGGLVRSAPCPVVVIPPACRRDVGNEDRSRPLVCAVGDDHRSDLACRLAAHLARRLQHPLVLAHVARVPADRDSEQILRSPRGVPVDVDRLLESRRRAALRLLHDRLQAIGNPPHARVRVELGETVVALRDVCADEDAELLVVGTAVRGRLEAAVEGSTALSLAADCPCPVAIVRAHRP